MSNIVKTEQEWRSVLTPQQFHILRKKGTEPPFSGALYSCFAPGTYHCAGCDALLFDSRTKFDSGSGWPSFESAVSGSVDFEPDYSLDTNRIEVICASCGGHLGHLFHDGPPPSGQRFCINSAALQFKPDDTIVTQKTETALFAAGCFWGVELFFSKIPGVEKTVVGYAGGSTVHPTYEQVSTGNTGHAESVQIIFHPDVVSFEQLVRYLFDMHDPTQYHRQGPDIGSQYRSVIFAMNQQQLGTAETIKRELLQKQPDIVTEIVSHSRFWPAEEYHQKYYRKQQTCKREV